MQLPVFPTRGQRFALCLLFFAVTFLVYGSSLRNQFVDWDDNLLIRENQIVVSMNAKTIAKAFTSYDPELYIPLTFLSYQIDHAIGGMNPFFFHLTNLVLHSLSAILVTWLLFLFIQNGWLALGLGLLFAIHPLNTEAVAWASARKDVLSTFFFFASFIGYLYAESRLSRKLFWLSVVLFVLGLLSKVMIVTLPAVLLLADIFFEGRITRRMFTNKIPYVTAAVIFGIIGVFGKAKILVSSTLWQKILMACKSTVFYIQKFFQPDGLSVLYPYTKPITLWSADFAVPLLLTILLVAVAAYQWKKRRLVSIGILFFMITLTPTFINFAKGGDIYFASDRYAYVPMVGLLLAIGSILSELPVSARTVRQQRGRVRMIASGMTIVLAICGVLAFNQAKIWTDSFSLFGHVLQFYPNSNIAHNNIGMELLGQGRTDEAIQELQTAFAIKPDPKTLGNIAAAKSQKGLYDEALNIFSRVLETDPASADATYGIGNVYQKQGKLLEAAAQYRKTIALDPEYFNAYNNLGGVYLLLEDWANAAMILGTSVELKPAFAASHYNLAMALKQLKKNDEAEAELGLAIALSPDDADALANLAVLLYDRQQIDEAAANLKKAFAADQSNPTGIQLLLRMKDDGFVR